MGGTIVEQLVHNRVAQLSFGVVVSALVLNSMEIPELPFDGIKIGGGLIVPDPINTNAPLEHPQIETHTESFPIQEVELQKESFPIAEELPSIMHMKISLDSDKDILDELNALGHLDEYKVFLKDWSEVKVLEVEDGVFKDLLAIKEAGIAGRQDDVNKIIEESSLMTQMTIDNIKMFKELRDVIVTNIDRDDVVIFAGESPSKYYN